MNYPDLSRQIQAHQLAYFRLHKNRYYVYHDLDHTQGVVKAAMQIANHYQLNEKDFFIVTTAAWFHDAGYFEDDLHHEKRGAEIAAAYLSKLGIDEDTIQKIQQCIIATTLPQSPKTKLEEIVCDSDLFHLGTDDFRERNKLMRKEAENRRDQPISKDEWRKSTIRLFMMHHYFTDYCQLLLGHKKKENLEKLQQKVAGKEKRSPGAISPVIPKTAKQPLPVKHRSALPALPVPPLTPSWREKRVCPLSARTIP
jgi:predicted metal-dependent HD superfamily phosphohydrolase